MIRALLLLIALAGCMPVAPPAPVVVPPVTHPDVVYVGDSLCASTYDWYGLTAQQIAGIVSDCVAGRSLMDITSLPDVRIVFLGLVTNSCKFHTVDEYRYKLQTLLTSTNARVYCVLPTNIVRGESCESWAQVMREECTDTINPHDYGVLPRAKDGLHWNPIDHKGFASALTSRI